MLTVKEINNSKPRTKNYKLTDSKGLYLFITPSGSKHWRLDYSYHLKRKTISLGSYPTLSLAQARRQQAEIKDLLAQGICPLEQRKQEKLLQKAEQQTFEDVAMQWFKQWSHDKHPKTTQQTWTRLETFVFPFFGKKPISRILLADFITCFKAMRASGALEVAKRNMQKVKSIMKFAYLDGLITHNPISDITPKDFLPSRKRRHHARIEEKDLAKLLLDIHNYYGSEITVIALKLMLLTFVRTSELIKAEWEEIDFDKEIWVIPAERMKMRRKHIVPLSTQSIQLLKQLQTLSANTPYLFPDDLGRQHHMSNNM
ncbi:integrase [Pelistega indica]|uniref:Integrase n=1 Tax=Pelistega indica TaxID=1414851 RepID=V8FV75_9BURK|nr:MULTISPECIES: integrase arm-type DNA-binding domain-containing protein [Pelistega]ETD68174.1 integrase [Pelistega indica]